jgi:proteasome lid subunit RPN8/RPN11
MEELFKLLEGDKERVGIILQSGEIVELENICSDPENAFELKSRDLLRLEDEAVATWHTHPNASSNLSVDDYQAFRNWPRLKHYVIGVDGVRCFVVQGGALVEA